MGDEGRTTERMNQLKVHQRETILTLWSKGWSARRIARELGFDRDTVSKYIREQRANPAAPSPGSDRPIDAPGPGADGVEGAKPATPSPGDPPVARAKSATPSAGTPSPRTRGVVTTALEAVQSNVSLCEAWRSRIEEGLEKGFSAKRIHQDLVSEHRFEGGYQSVKRFVRKLEREAPLPFRRMEFAPGEQVQVDFGTGPWIVSEGGRRRSKVFRAVLSCSRKGYSEATFDEKTEAFLRCLENAYRHFGGVPQITTPDNLKAAVRHPDWYDPQLNPKLAAFAAHYGTVIMPTRPKLPRHKGRVERGIDFVKEALRGRTFKSLAEANLFLANWEKNVADTRIHGTTRRHVEEHFRLVESPALRPLPYSLFPSFTEGRRSVHLDGHVEFDRAYYSVPPEYTGREVWVRGESRVIRIYSAKMEPIAVHARQEPGMSRSTNDHIHPLKRSAAERGALHLLERCESLGPCCGAWALAMHKHRGLPGIRVMQGLLALARKTPREQLERAAARALQRAAWGLRDLKAALAEPANVVQVDFLQTHPLIGDMDTYRIPLPS